jgi:glutamine synthetase
MRFPVRKEKQVVVPEAAAGLVTFLAENNIETIRAGGVDLDGLWRAKSVAAEAVAKGKPLSLSDFVFGIDIHDQLYEPNGAFTGWKTGWPDITMQLDARTLRSIPWEDGIATAICDYVGWDGNPIDLSPRYVLRQAERAVANAGLEARVGVELEFFVLDGRPKLTESGTFVTPPPILFGSHSYHPFRGVEQLERWSRILRDYGLPIESSLTEWGPGQFEINLHYGSPVEVADNIVMFKHAIKELAAREGLTVTFIARMASDGPGSSGHCHVSLWNNGTNVFFDESAPHGASELLRRFAAGVIANYRDVAVLALPFVNSYRRVGEYLSSPTRLNIGVENRTTGLRAITHNPGGARLELRVPGADANPYLTLATLLHTGIKGLEDDLPPAEFLYDDGYVDLAAPKVPRSLDEGIDCLERSDVARKFFGDAFVDHYLHSRRWELEQWRQTVTTWELARYLEMV